MSTEKISETTIRIAQCMECPGARFTGRSAKRNGLKHAESHAGHRVMVSYTYSGTYKLKGVE